MADIIALPERNVREWRQVEATLRGVMASESNEPAAIEHVVSHLRPIFLGLYTAENVVVHQQTADLETHIHVHIERVITGLLVELARVLLENHELREGRA